MIGFGGVIAIMMGLSQPLALVHTCMRAQTVSIAIFDQPFPEGGIVKVVFLDGTI